MRHGKNIYLLLPSFCLGIKLDTRKIKFFSLVAQYTILKLETLGRTLLDSHLK